MKYIKHKLLLTTICSSTTLLSFAGDPAAVSCLRDIAERRAYTDADVSVFCLRKKPVWRMNSWRDNGRLVKPANPMTPTAFNSSELKMCGNPCN